MRKIIGLLVVALVVGGGVFYLVKKDDAASTSSINKLTEDGKSVECTYSYSEDDKDIKGKGYFTADKKARLDYTSTGSNEQDVSMIITTKEQIFWDNSTKEGVKFELSDRSSLSKYGGINSDKDINFSCKDWKVDESVFEVPSYIKISDLSALKRVLENK